MNQHHMTKMASKVEEALKDPTHRPCSNYNKVLGAIRSYWEGKAAFVWSREDIMEFAESMGKKITEDDADVVLHSLIRKHDADVGINWLVVRHAILFDC